MAMPNCRRLLRQFALRAASRASDNAGSKRAIKTPMIAMTTSSSMSVKPRFFMERTPEIGNRGQGTGDRGQETQSLVRTERVAADDVFRRQFDLVVGKAAA